MFAIQVWQKKIFVKIEKKTSFNLGKDGMLAVVVLLNYWTWHTKLDYTVMMLNMAPGQDNNQSRVSAPL